MTFEGDDLLTRHQVPHLASAIWRKDGRSEMGQVHLSEEGTGLEGRVGLCRLAQPKLRMEGNRFMLVLVFLALWAGATDSNLSANISYNFSPPCCLFPVRVG